MGIGKCEQSENRNGMGMGKEEMEKNGQDTWRMGKGAWSENGNGERRDGKNRAGHVEGGAK